MDRWLDQTPEGEASGSGADGATLPQENDGNVERGRIGDESVRLATGESP